MRLEYIIKRLIMENKLDEAKCVMQGAWIAIKHNLTVDDLFDVLTETSAEGIIPMSLLRMLINERERHEKNED